LHTVRKTRYGALLNGRLNESGRKDMIVGPRHGSGRHKHMGPDPSALDFAGMPDPRALGLEDMSDPSKLGLQPCHTQARPKTLKTFSIFLIFFLKK
jgi:hypothetical protein